MVLVDYVCELNGEKDILIGSRSRYIFFSLMVPNVDITELPAHDCWEALKLKETTSPIKIESKQDVSQDLDDDDDDSLPPQTDVADPIYVKQLIEYFSVDTSNQMHTKCVERHYSKRTHLAPPEISLWHRSSFLSGRIASFVDRARQPF